MDVSEHEAVVTETDRPKLSYDEKASRASVIAKPMASKKLAKKLTKLIKKANQEKTYLRSGLKLVQGKISKGERGIAVIAGNVTPIDVVCHVPALCEDRQIPYVFIPTGKDLGVAMGVKRCCLIVLIREHENYKSLFNECFQDVKLLPPPESVET